MCFVFAGIATNHGICVANFLSIRFIYTAEIFPLSPPVLTPLASSISLSLSVSFDLAGPFLRLSRLLFPQDLSIAMVTMSRAHVCFMLVYVCLWIWKCDYACWLCAVCRERWWLLLVNIASKRRQWWKSPCAKRAMAQRLGLSSGETSEARSRSPAAKAEKPKRKTCERNTVDEREMHALGAHTQYIRPIWDQPITISLCFCFFFISVSLSHSSYCSLNSRQSQRESSE